MERGRGRGGGQEGKERERKEEKKKTEQRREETEEWGGVGGGGGCINNPLVTDRTSVINTVNTQYFKYCSPRQLDI